MLPNKGVLTRLIRSNTSFLLYGQKASGKTSLIQSLFAEANVNYIQINCTLANKRANFLKLFNVELHKYLKSKGIVHAYSAVPPSNLDSWINQLKKVYTERTEVIGLLDKLYVFMDNIEQMVMSESFLPSFYSACQKQFPFRFSFVFCGINFLKKEYALELPFRTMITFCMPKPIQEFEKTITKAVENALKQNFKDKITNQQIAKSTHLFLVQIKHAFDNVEFNLQKMKGIAKAIVDGTVPSLQEKDLAKSIMKLINVGDLKRIIQQVREHGPMEESLMKRKINALDNEQVLDTNPNLEYYPNLILTSIHLADYYSEKEDRRRFKDYKSKTNMRNKDMKRSDFKIGKHNINRIISIADSLESQAKDNQKEKVLEHHSLDFFSQFEHLRKMNRIKFTNNKMTGVVKEEETKAFMAKYDLKYDQFMTD